MLKALGFTAFCGKKKGHSYDTFVGLIQFFLDSSYMELPLAKESVLKLSFNCEKVNCCVLRRLFSHIEQRVRLDDLRGQ